MPYTKLHYLEATGTKIKRIPAQDHQPDTGKLKFQSVAIINEKCFLRIGGEAVLAKERLDVELFEMHLLGFSGNG